MPKEIIITLKQTTEEVNFPLLPTDSYFEYQGNLYFKFASHIVYPNVRLIGPRYSEYKRQTFHDERVYKVKEEDVKFKA